MSDEFRSPANVAFAMALMVCYHGRKRFYVDHLVFALHVHTFLAVLVAAMLITS